MYVHSGIAAADALCCARLGVHAHGENHDEAVRLLRRAIGRDARHLRTLLSLKSKAGYSHQPVSAVDLARATRAAEALVELARTTDG